MSRCLRAGSFGHAQLARHAGDEATVLVQRLFGGGRFLASLCQPFVLHKSQLGAQLLQQWALHCCWEERNVSLRCGVKPGIFGWMSSIVRGKRTCTCADEVDFSELYLYWYQLVEVDFSELYLYWYQLVVE